MKDGQCPMKGFLSFSIMWIISKKPLNGAEISQELTKRKGTKPSPGTIYPVLKDLKERGLIKADKSKNYELTTAGKKSLEKELDNFFHTFPDIDEMQKCRH